MHYNPNTTTTLFTQLIDVGYNVRKSKLDGMESWQPYKNQYLNVDQCYQMQPQFINLAKSIDYNVDQSDIDHQKVTITIDGATASNTIEKDHFFVQLFRIAIMSNFDLKLVKLLQIAYNIGQFKAELDDFLD